MDPTSEFSTGARRASAAPSGTALNAASNVGHGTVVIQSPRSWMAAASLKAPGSPWKATRAVLRSEVLIGWRYLAIRGAKPKAKIRSGQKTICREHRVQGQNILARGESAAEMAVALS